MLQGINLDEVRQYNATLKQYRDKAASLNAEIEYNTKELNVLCEELSKELGKPVTKDNIEQIYMEQVQAINSTLQSGNAVLSRIANEEQSINTPTQTTPVTPVTLVQQTPQMTPRAYQTVPVQQAPVQQQPQATPQTQVPPVIPAPINGNIFNGQPAQLGMPGAAGELPKLFNI